MKIKICFRLCYTSGCPIIKVTTVRKWIPMSQLLHISKCQILSVISKKLSTGVACCTSQPQEIATTHLVCLRQLNYLKELDIDLTFHVAQLRTTHSSIIQYYHLMWRKHSRYVAANSCGNVCTRQQLCDNFLLLLTDFWRRLYVSAALSYLRKMVSGLVWPLSTSQGRVSCCLTRWCINECSTNENRFVKTTNTCSWLPRIYSSRSLSIKYVTGYIIFLRRLTTD